MKKMKSKNVQKEKRKECNKIEMKSPELGREKAQERKRKSARVRPDKARGEFNGCCNSISIV